MKKILFVCTGNICRSPLAEGIFNHYCKIRGLENNFMADSCAVTNYEVGNSPDSRTVKVAKESGFIITHIAKKIALKDIESSDIILCMEQYHKDEVLKLCKTQNQREKVELFTKYDPIAKSEYDVPDPYYGDQSLFKSVQEIIQRTSLNLLESLLIERE